MLSAHSCPVGQLGAKDTGGMSVYIRELARELGRRGHLVDIYTRIHNTSDPLIVELGTNARIIHLKAGHNRVIHKLEVYSCLPEFTRNLEGYRKDNSLQYDVIFSHYWLSGKVGTYLQHWWSVPHIVLFHTLGTMKNNTGIGKNEPAIRIGMEKELASNCHRIIATTAKEKEHLIRYHGTSPKRIGVVPCGVNLELFYPIDRRVARQQLGFTDEKLILFVGRIEPLKGIDCLLEALYYLQNGPRPRLLIIGGDKYSYGETQKLIGLSRQLQIEDSVTFIGMIPQDQMLYYYGAADACVVPSYYESFSLVALESLACGTPVVATDVGDLRSIIHDGETGYVVANNDPIELADKVALLVTQPDIHIQSIVMRASVSRFSWSNIAEEFIKECQMVLSNHLAPVT
jgi:D-inositol-3-phosphate glycosyltransferase